MRAALSRHSTLTGSGVLRGIRSMKPNPEEQAERPEGAPEAWHASERDQVLVGLGTSPETGLSESEAARRLAEHGPNELAEAPRPSFWQKLLEQFDNFIVIILIVASIVSALLGDYVEAAAIMAIVLLNAILGVIQEGKAEE